MNDITDTDFSSGPAGHVAGLQQVTHQDVVSAAEAVVTAAANARAREFDDGSMVAIGMHVSDAGGVDPYGTYAGYYNRAEGEFWISLGDNRFGITSHPTMGDSCYVRTYGNNDPTVPEEKQFEWIKDSFQYFHERWPSYPQTMAMHCDTAKAAIQSGQMTAVKHVDDVVDNWQGAAQQDFREYFLDPFLVNTLTNQQALLDEMAVAMYAYEGILKQGRIDAKTIAEQAVEGLDAIDVGGGLSFTAILGVVGVAVAVVTTVATAGTTTALTLGLIGAGVQAVSVVASEQTVEGATVDEILDSLDSTLDQLRLAMDAEEKSLADALVETTGQVNGYLEADNPNESGTFLPNEPVGDDVPNVTDGTVPSPGDFHPR